MTLLGVEGEKDARLNVPSCGRQVNRRDKPPQLAFQKPFPHSILLAKAKCCRLYADKQSFYAIHQNSLNVFVG